MRADRVDDLSFARDDRQLLIVFELELRLLPTIGLGHRRLNLPGQFLLQAIKRLTSGRATSGGTRKFAQRTLIRRPSLRDLRGEMFEFVSHRCVSGCCLPSGYTSRKRQHRLRATRPQPAKFR